MSSIPSLAIIIPVRDEEAALGPMLDELLPHARQWNAIVAVGLNGCRDKTRDIAESRRVVIGETPVSGYGHGCLAAVNAIAASGVSPSAYIFMAGDGANDPSELSRLIEAWQNGAQLAIGQRTCSAANWPKLGIVRACCTTILGVWAAILTGCPYYDLGPFRLIDRNLFEKIAPREITWGWTIEPQILAPRLGFRVTQVSVTERLRIAGEQKVTGVSLRNTLRIGIEILRAGWRSRVRTL